MTFIHKQHNGVLPQNPRSFLGRFF
jgi:hypothetical protein